MIHTYSRYYTGNLAQDENDFVSVWRKFPTTRSVALTGYIWKDGDTWSAVATAFLGDPNSYHRVLDLNPEIMDPWRMEPGTAIWVPNV